LLFNRLHKARNINSLLAILLFAFQLSQIPESNQASLTKLSETSFHVYYYSIELSAAGSNHNSVKQNQERNFSSTNNFYDKNDLISVADLTDSKRIYNGGFSTSFRFKTFLTAIFSTST